MPLNIIADGTILRAWTRKNGSSAKPMSSGMPMPIRKPSIIAGWDQVMEVARVMK